MKLVYQYMANFFTFPPTSSHLYPLQVENCGSNSRLVVDEDDNGKFRLQRVNIFALLFNASSLSSNAVQHIYMCADQSYVDKRNVCQSLSESALLRSNLSIKQLYIMLFHLEFVLPFLVSGIHLSSGDSNAEQIILALNFQISKDVDLKSNHLICEIHSEDYVFVRSSGCEMPEPLCPDGSINKTCFPMRDDKILNCQCICHSRRRADFIVPVTEWTTWAASTNSYQPFAGERSLILPLVNQAVVQEFRSMDVFKISYYNLPSSVSSASSTSAGHEAFIAHLNFGSVGPCTWLGTGSTPWIQMTLLAQYVVVGAVI